MKISLIPEVSIPLSSWAGGTSREYYIYPPEASYREKNFLVRLSTAASNSDSPSNYTDLPGITRYLIILEGTANVSHEGHHELLMKPYDPIDTFDGGWKTVSQGMVTDFNLMLGNGVQGSMGLIESSGEIYLNHAAACSAVPRASHEWLGLFCAASTGRTGSFAAITGDGKSFNLQRGDLLLLEDFSQELPSLNITLAEGKLIRLDAWLE
ncbi:HutD family protein [Treponema primitia]|uniref:HutD family protein n=1 Tax=Treponema primitia TaxID=88058 RepID=UPI0002554E35|nr:HutD family protein [Treponema primitia]